MRPELPQHHTRPEFLEPWDPGLLPGLRWGRSQLDQLVPLTTRAIADSGYNARELRATGFDEVRVSPVMWRLGIDVAPAGDREPVVLFVGRVVSNKRHEDLVASMAMVHDAQTRCPVGARRVTVDRHLRSRLASLIERTRARRTSSSSRARSTMQSSPPGIAERACFCVSSTRAFVYRSSRRWRRPPRDRLPGCGHVPGDDRRGRHRVNRR